MQNKTRVVAALTLALVGCKSLPSPPNVSEQISNALMQYHDVDDLLSAMELIVPHDTEDKIKLAVMKANLVIEHKSVDIAARAFDVYQASVGTRLHHIPKPAQVLGCLGLKLKTINASCHKVTSTALEDKIQNYCSPVGVDDFLQNGPLPQLVENRFERGLKAGCFHYLKNERKQANKALYDAMTVADGQPTLLTKFSSMQLKPSSQLGWQYFVKQLETVGIKMPKPLLEKK
jgi:hypothetical protein